jgi:2-C-methyl-D-erythritol 4-phosphate cytidylyltransferase
VPSHSASIATIVLAGGSGARLGLADGANKVYLPLDGRPLLAWSLRALYAALHPISGVLVIREGDEADAASAIAAAAITPPAVVVGGTTRTQSECAGLDALRTQIDSGVVDLVLIHDGARPFPGAGMLIRLVDAAREHGAAVPTLPVGAGLLRADHDGFLSAVDIDRVRSVQTPQAFAARPLLEALDDARATGAHAVDTASLVALVGGPIAVAVDGDENNLKVTHPDDVDAAARIARTHGAWDVIADDVPKRSEP